MEGVLSTSMDAADKAMWNQIKNLTFCHTLNGKPGVTWLELYVLHLLAGGTLDIVKQCSNSRVTLEKAVREYRRRVMHLVGMNVPDHHARLFNAAKNTTYPLKHLAVFSSVAAINAGILLTKEQDAALQL